MDQKALSEWSRASIVAVGTELTTGQTENTNASWLSRELEKQGVETVLHLAVADQREAILRALSSASQVAELVLVTGGLGPTADDFTRQVVAEFCGLELSFDQDSWTRIVERLGRFQIPVAESNRQQCYFPVGSTILANPSGTASGFLIPQSTVAPAIAVLPGPPREVQAIWQSVLSGVVTQRAPGLTKRLMTWQCLGKSEAELGELVETALQGGGLETGYRAHRPYVEIKVWTPLILGADQLSRIQAMERAISPWLIQGPLAPPIADEFFTRLTRLGLNELIVEDLGSRGLLAERVGAALRQCMLRVGQNGRGIRLICTSDTGAPSISGNSTAEKGQFRLALYPAGADFSWRAGCSLWGPFLKQQDWDTELKSPFRPKSPEQASSEQMQERLLGWIAEATLFWGLGVLRSLEPGN